MSGDAGYRGIPLLIYDLFELQRSAFGPARLAAGSYRMLLDSPCYPMANSALARNVSAAIEVFERTTREYDKPVFGIDTTNVDGTDVSVSEDIVWRKPFCNLIHFKRAIGKERSALDPKVLLVAPMSGHYATLLRGTVESLLPNHDVYITDWIDASRVPTSAGSFGLDDYVSYICDLTRFFAGDVHIAAVCQPSVPVLAAVSVMEAAGEKHVPHSMTLMGGPVDTRIAPTAVNKLAEERGTNWFARNLIAKVPWTKHGAGRLVYPGFMQLTGFMAMNIDRHVKAHKDLFVDLVRNDGDSADKHRDFYDEYLAVMDLTAEFYLETVDQVFVQHALPKGQLRYRGKLVDPAAISRVALMTVEGEKDDITGIGQCAAAHDLCTNIPDDAKYHFECKAVGHYGIFNGRRYREQILPRLGQFFRMHDPRAELAPALTFGVVNKPAVAATSPTKTVTETEIDGPLLNGPAAAMRVWGLAGRMMLEGMSPSRGAAGRS